RLHKRRCAFGDKAAVGPIDQDDADVRIGPPQPGIDFVSFLLCHELWLPQNEVWESPSIGSRNLNGNRLRSQRVRVARWGQRKTESMMTDPRSTDPRLDPNVP